MLQLLNFAQLTTWRSFFTGNKLVAGCYSCPVDYSRSAAATRQDQSYLFVGDIYHAVSLRNNRVMLFYYGQFNEHEIIAKLQD